MANRYQVTVEWSDPRFGPQSEKFCEVASNPAAACGKAWRSFQRERNHRGDVRGARAALAGGAMRWIRTATKVPRS